MSVSGPFHACTGVPALFEGHRRQVRAGMALRRVLLINEVVAGPRTRESPRLERISARRAGAP
jgi:hypothetical protein